MITSILDTLNHLLTLQKVSRRFPTVGLERGVLIKGDLANLTLGNKVLIQSGVVLHLGGMDWCMRQGALEIGDDGVISPNCVFYAGGPGGIRIGKNFDCGPGVAIFSSRTDYLKGPGHYYFAPVDIGDRVIVFAHSVIGPGVKIGDDAVIAAGSVVTHDVPSNALVGGSPARVIKMLDRGEPCSE